MYNLLEIRSDVSHWPWPWSLRPKSDSLALALWHKSLGLGLGLESGPWPWPWPWPRPRLRRSRPRCYRALNLRPGLCGIEFVPLGYLFERILAVPASSAPVERVYFLSVGWSSAHIMRKCQTSCSSHCVCHCLPSVPSLLTVKMVNVHAVAWLILW